MSDVVLKLDGDEVRPILAKALLESLTQEKRDELIQRAIEHLITHRQYSGGPTMLEHQFQIAAADIARDIARQHIDTPKVRELMNEVVVQAWERVMSPDVRDKLVERLGDTIVRAFFGERY